MSRLLDVINTSNAELANVQRAAQRTIKNIDRDIFAEWQGKDYIRFVPETGELKIQQAGNVLATYGNNTIPNIEPTPNTVRYAQRIYPLVLDGAAESAALYCRIDPTEGSADQKIGFYFEVTDAQQDTEAAAMKAVHQGAGDCIYVACFNSGPSYESASFYNGNRGIISTNQFEQPGGTTDFTYSTLFQGVWGYDGTGGSTTPAAYGMFYAALSLGNSFRTRLQDSAATGFAWGRTEIAITEYDLARDRFQVYNNGVTRLLSTKATAASTEEAAPSLALYGSFWDGLGANDKSILFQPAMDVAGDPSLTISLGDAGLEAPVLDISLSELDVNSLAINNAASIDVGDGSSGSPSIAFSSDLDTGLYRIGANEMGFVTGGSTRMRIDSVGDVGINTTDPKAQLHVAETAGTITPNAISDTLVLEDAFQPGMTFISLNTGTNSIYFCDQDDDDVGKIVYTHSDDTLTLTVGATSMATLNTTRLSISGDLYTDGGSAAAPSHTFSSDTDTGMFRPAADAVGITSGGTERFRVDSSGMSILVGAAASRPLDINGDTMRLRNKRTISASTNAGFQGEWCWDDNYIYVYDGSGWNRIAWSSSSW